MARKIQQLETKALNFDNQIRQIKSLYEKEKQFLDKIDYQYDHLPFYGDADWLSTEILRTNTGGTTVQGKLWKVSIDQFPLRLLNSVKGYVAVKPSSGDIQGKYLDGNIHIQHQINQIRNEDNLTIIFDDNSLEEPLPLVANVDIIVSWIGQTESIKKIDDPMININNPSQYESDALNQLYYVRLFLYFYNPMRFS